MSTRDLASIALFAALVAALGMFPPLAVGPVPITAQSLGVMLAGSILGARRGLYALLAFVALVAVGLPVLAGGRGGLGVLAGPSGGFVVGFPVGAFVVGWLTQRWWRRYGFARAFAANLVGGIGALYAVGVPWLGLVGDGLVQAAVASAVFLPGDVAKAVVAAAAAVGVANAYPVIGRERAHR